MHSFDHLVCTQQHRGWNIKRELFGSFCIHDKLEICRSLDGQFTWGCAAQDAGDVIGGTAPQLRSDRTVTEQAASSRHMPPLTYCWQSGVGRQSSEDFRIAIELGRR